MTALANINWSTSRRWLSDVRPTRLQDHSVQGAGAAFTGKPSALDAGWADADGRPCVDVFQPPRPYIMHRKTYARLKTQGEEIERQLRQGRVYIPRERTKYDTRRSVCC